MDALALLCNLHADGPHTLRELREAGIRSLDDVVNAPAEQLVEVTGHDAAAERFRREARVLESRLTSGELLDEEGAGDENLQLEEESAGAEAGEPELLERDPAAEVVDPAVSAVAEAWRKRDAHDPAPAVLVPQPPPVATLGGMPLIEAEVDGLDMERVESLLAVGIETVEQFTGARALELTGALDLPFTQISRLQFLAKRAARRSPARSLPIRNLAPSAASAPSAAGPVVGVARLDPVDAPVDVARDWPAAEPRPASEDLDASGPFA